MPNNINEFRPIPNFPDYLINQNGDVYSVPRFDKCGRPQGGIILKRKNDPRGYHTYILRKDCKSYTRWLHRLVAEAFLPHYSPSLEINHIDGNPSNSHVSNLEVCTARANINHRERVCNNKKRWGVWLTTPRNGNRPFWVAKIRVGGKQIHLGSSNVNPEPLYEKYREAYRSLHGAYPY